MGLIGFVAVAGLYFGYGKFCTAGQPNKLGDFTAPGGSRIPCSTSPTDMLAACCGWIGSKLQSNKGFERFPDLTYKKLSGNEFDLDGIGGNEESLTEFLDEAENDDYAPRVYGERADDRRGYDRPSREESSIVAGSARDATEAVPKLQAPPGTGGGTSHFNIGTGDEDL